jgi:hypothetical protein
VTLGLETARCAYLQPTTRRPLRKHSYSAVRATVRQEIQYSLLSELAGFLRTMNTILNRSVKRVALSVE